MSRKLMFILCLLVLSVLVVPAFAQDDSGVVTVAPDGEVVIGLAASLSGEGLVPLGEDIQRGAELALDDRPTVSVGGTEFAVAINPQDDLCSAEGGQAVANLFAADPSVVAVVGPMCSSAAFAAAPILDEAGYTSISPSATAAKLTNSGFTSFNRTVVGDTYQGVVMAHYIYENLGITSIATIHDGSLYGEGLVDVVTQEFESLGGEIVFADAVNVGDTDFRSLLEDVAAEEPGLIYFGGFSAEGARLAQQRADVGLEDIVFMGADGIKGGEFPTLAGDSAEGVYASSAIPSAANAEAVDALQARYIEKYGVEQPTGPFWTNTYDATNMILDALEAVGTVDDSGNLVVDRAALAEYVRSIQGFEGLGGTLNCDGTGECVVNDIGIIQYQGGAEVQVAVGSIAEDGSVTITAEE
jgi:branched-chain amino acid transport system substrate-binding protein